MVNTFSSWYDCGFFLGFMALGTIRGVGVVGVVGVEGFVVRDSDVGNRKGVVGRGRDGGRQINRCTWRGSNSM